MSDLYKADENFDPIGNRIDEILDGADGIDFDPKEAGYTEIAPGFWDDGTDFGGFYVESEQLETKYKRNVSSKDNFYWLYKKSFMYRWIYLLIAIALFCIGDIWYTYNYALHELDSGMKMVSVIVGISLFFSMVLIVGDLTFIPYHFDRKENRSQKVSGEIWYFNTESEVNPIKCLEATRYFPESLRVQRSKIYFRDLDSDFTPQCGKRLNPYLHEKVPKLDREDLKQMLYLKYVFTSKKYQMFKKLFEVDSDMQYEIVYYEKSKVIKEIRPLKGETYSPEALEILFLINRMYP